MQALCAYYKRPLLGTTKGLKNEPSSIFHCEVLTMASKLLDKRIYYQLPSRLLVGTTTSRRSLQKYYVHNAAKSVLIDFSRVQ